MILVIKFNFSSWQIKAPCGHKIVLGGNNISFLIIRDRVEAIFFYYEIPWELLPTNFISDKDIELLPLAVLHEVFMQV